MKFQRRLLAGRFVRRDNRFRVSVELRGQITAAHLPNSGRLSELLVPEAVVWLAPATSQSRKTAFDLTLVEFNGELVSVDARLPNHLLHEAIIHGHAHRLGNWESVRREVSTGDSRFDFLLEGSRGRYWLEAKSVTLVDNGIAMFPDAPTLRGRRHVKHLQELAVEGDQAAVAFVIQRSDACEFRPHRSADPEFATALQDAHQDGVEVLAYGCEVNLDGIRLGSPLPVVLSAA